MQGVVRVLMYGFECSSSGVHTVLCLRSTVVATASAYMGICMIVCPVWLHPEFAGSLRHVASDCSITTRVMCVAARCSPAAVLWHCVLPPICGTASDV